MLKVYPSDNNVKSRKEAGKMDPLNTKTLPFGLWFVLQPYPPFSLVSSFCS